MASSSSPPPPPSRLDPPEIARRSDDDDDGDDDAPPLARRKSARVGGTDRGSRSRRRSTLSTLSASMVDAARQTRKRLRSHTVSTLCLCSCVLSMFYLLMSPFPYSGFMAVHLVPDLTNDDAGTYAGMLSSSFMIGRALSSIPWGTAADVYGRRFVLLVSLANSAVLSVAFGFSVTFAWALAVRFLMGFGNGTMIVVRTMASELARGDKKLEARAVGLVMSMVGYGMLIGPAVGGILSDPMKQYPLSAPLWFGGTFSAVLVDFPYVLPNVIGAILCVLSLAFVSVSIEETLPDDVRRDGWAHFVPDIMKWICGLPGRVWTWSTSRCRSRGGGNADRAAPSSIGGGCGDDGGGGGERERLVKWSDHASYQREEDTFHDEENEDCDDSVEDDLKILEAHESAELSALLSSESSRRSYSSAMHCRRRSSSGGGGGHTHRRRSSSAADAAQRRRRSRPSVIKVVRHQLSAISDVENEEGGGEKEAAPSPPPPPSSSPSSHLADKTTRDHLISYWSFGFVNVTINEAFPLFCMSTHGGLDMPESSIGGIGAAAGLVFCVCQYFIFTSSMKSLGLYGTARVGSFLGNVPAALTPISLLLDGAPRARYAFLTALMAVQMIFASVFYGVLTIATNRTVDASRRASLNGLSSIGSSAGRGLGPLFAGVLVSFSMSSGVLPPEFGSLVVYTVIALLGLVAFWITYNLEEEDEEEEEGKDGDVVEKEKGKDGGASAGEGGEVR